MERPDDKKKLTARSEGKVNVGRGGFGRWVRSEGNNLPQGE